jgi:hypothetical protein
MSELLFGEFYRKILQPFKTLNVSAQSIPNNTVNLSAGGFWIHDDRGGTYINYNGSTISNIIFPDNSYWALITIKYNSQIHIIYGEDSIDPILPAIPANEYPIAAIILKSSDGGIITNENIYDLRSLLDLSYTNATSIQKMEIASNNILKSTKKSINFIEGNLIYIDISNNTEDELLNIIVSLSNYNPGDIVIPQTSYNLNYAPGTSNKYSRSSHNHGTIINPFIAHEQTYNHALLHSNINDPTSNEKQALNGSDGTPSTSNRYVTEEDDRLLWVIKTFDSIENISAYRVLNNHLEYADNTTITKDSILGISINSAAINYPLIVQFNGVVTNNGWNWDITKPIYLGTNGNMTQDISTGKIQRIAIPLTTTSLYINILDYDEEVITTEPTTTVTPTSTVAPTTTTFSTTTLPMIFAGNWRIALIPGETMSYVDYLGSTQTYSDGQSFTAYISEFPLVFTFHGESTNESIYHWALAATSQFGTYNIYMGDDIPVRGTYTLDELYGHAWFHMM